MPLPNPKQPKPQRHPFVTVNPADNAIDPDDANPEGRTPARDSVEAKGDPTKTSDPFGGAQSKKPKKKKGKAPKDDVEQVAESRLLKAPTIKAKKAPSSVRKGLAPKRGGRRGSGRGLARLFNNALSAHKRRKQMKQKYADKESDLKQKYADKTKDVESKSRDGDDEHYIQKKLHRHRLEQEVKRRISGEHDSNSPKPGHKWEGSKQVPIGKKDHDEKARHNQHHLKQYQYWSKVHDDLQKHGPSDHPKGDSQTHSAVDDKGKHITVKHNSPAWMKKTNSANHEHLVNQAKSMRDHHFSQLKSVKEGAPVNEYADGIWRTMAIMQRDHYQNKERKLRQHLEQKHRELKNKMRQSKPQGGGMKTESIRVARSLSLRETTSLMRKAQYYGVHLSIIKEVYNRGLLDWNPRDKMSPQQKAFSRVNSFIAGGKARDLDYDLALESGNPRLMKETNSKHTAQIKAKHHMDQWAELDSKPSGNAFVDGATKYVNKGRSPEEIAKNQYKADRHKQAVIAARKIISKG